MQVEVKIDPQYTEVKVFILTDKETENIENLVKMIESEYSHQVIGYKENKIVAMNQSDIIRIYSENRKIVACTVLGNYFLHLRLFELEEDLKNDRFIRISNSEIINLRKAKHFDMSGNGTIRVVFFDDTYTFVSRRYVSIIKHSLGL